MSILTTSFLNRPSLLVIYMFNCTYLGCIYFYISCFMGKQKKLSLKYEFTTLSKILPCHLNWACELVYFQLSLSIFWDTNDFKVHVTNTWRQCRNNIHYICIHINLIETGTMAEYTLNF
jgi:hypothetical protein